MGLDIFGAYDIIRVENKNSSFKSKYGKSSPEANWAEIFFYSAYLRRDFSVGTHVIAEKINEGGRPRSLLTKRKIHGKEVIYNGRIFFVQIHDGGFKSR